MNNFKDVENIRISITHDCNLKCDYCSDHNSKSNLEIIQDIDSVIAFLKTLPKLKLVILYGGEPLFYKGTMNIFKQLLNELPDIKISIFTNGTIWNEEFAELLRTNNNTAVNFTRANSRKSQDIHRQFKNGTSSYDIVTNNLRKYSLINPNKILMMNTVTEDCIDELYAGVIDDYKYTPNVVVNLVLNDGYFTQHKVFEEELMKVTDYILDHKNLVLRNIFKTPNDNPIWFKRNYNIAIQKTYNEFILGIKNIVIDVNGKIYASTTLQGTEHWMGDIYGNINQCELDFYQNVRENGKCNDCKYRYSCQPFYEVYNPHEVLAPYKTDSYCKITEVYMKVQNYYFTEGLKRNFDK